MACAAQTLPSPPIALQLFSYVPRLCLPHNRSRCYDWPLDFVDVIFAAPTSPDPLIPSRLVGGYLTSYQDVWSYG